MTTSLRKIEHLQICANDPVEAHVSAGFDDVHLIHCALPEIDKDEIDTATELFGKVMAAPLLIASMTGGHPDTYPINRALALAAEHLGVGSRRCVRYAFRIRIAILHLRRADGCGWGDDPEAALPQSVIESCPIRTYPSSRKISCPPVFSPISP